LVIGGALRGEGLARYFRNRTLKTLAPASISDAQFQMRRDGFFGEYAFDKTQIVSQVSAKARI
jgi:hypothetical protein